jgi:hypothetical protein
VVKLSQAEVQVKSSRQSQLRKTVLLLLLIGAGGAIAMRHFLPLGGDITWWRLYNRAGDKIDVVVFWGQVWHLSCSCDLYPAVVLTWDGC